MLLTEIFKHHDPKELMVQFINKCGIHFRMSDKIFQHTIDAMNVSEVYKFLFNSLNKDDDKQKFIERFDKYSKEL